MLGQLARLVLLVVVGFLVPSVANAELVVKANVELEERWRWEPVEAVLTQLAASLNQDLRNYGEVSVSLARCGEATVSNTRRRKKAPKITICTELVEQILAHTDERFSDEYMGPLAITQLSFILTHELSHALVDLLGLPAGAADEGAIDQIVFLLSEDAGTLLPEVASFWATQGQQPALAGYAAKHGFDSAGPRFEHMLCWAYGADSLARAGLLAHVPKSLRERCVAEADASTHSWRPPLSPHLAPHVGTLANRRSATGVWSFSEHMVGTDNSYRCTASGALTLWEGLYGTMQLQETCAQEGKPSTTSDDPSAVHAIEATARGFNFMVGDHCRYTAHYEDASRLTVRGEVQCRNGSGTFFGTR